MHGVGIRPAVIPAEACRPAVLLDVTRLISRIGRGHPTGIDRVEAAWLGYLASDPDNRLICRTRWGQLILPAGFGGRILRWLGLCPDGLVEDRPAASPVSVKARKLLGSFTTRPAALAVRFILLRHALARAGRDGQGLDAAITRSGLHGNAVYLNVGHSNQEAAFLAAMPLKRVVMIHDVIPLDYPQWTRASQVSAFARRFDAVLQNAELVVTVSEATAARVAHWAGLRKHPRVPILAAHIGTTLAPPEPVPLPETPFFLALGTIEPRKNHGLLLDLWAQLEVPATLVVAGRRGWLNEDIFARLDRLGPDDRIIELSDLSDGQIATLLDHCHGLLFPSFAEGFGLPLTEAACKGVPILCGPLESTRELLDNYPQYIDYHVYEWAGAVSTLAKQGVRRYKPVQVPEWREHFAKVLGAFV